MLPRRYLSLVITLVAVPLMPARAASEDPLSPVTRTPPPSDGAAASAHQPSRRSAKTLPRSGVLETAAPRGKLIRISARALSAARALAASRGRHVQILWSASTGTPVRLRGPLGDKNPAPPERVAANFLKSHHRLFSLKSDLSDLNVSGISGSSAGHHITFQQLCDGIPVEGGKIKVHLFKDGRVQMVSSRISPGLRVDTCPCISMDQAIDIACRHLGLNGGLRGPVVAEKVVLPEPYPGSLAWKVSMPATQPCGDWVVMVDAQNGTVISVRDIRMFATGEGRVFDPNPVVVLRTTSLSDENDSASAVPSKAYSTVLLEDLDGTGYLRGPYVDTGFTSDRAYSPQLDFSYDRSEPGFEEVMIYYHIQQFQKYLREQLGFSFDTRQVFADAHASDDDNSWFSPLVRAIYFGDGGVDDAEDAHVIVHEYIHALTYDVLRDRTVNQEADAMSEGTADYFGAGFFAGHDFESATFAQWDGISNTPVGVRPVDSSKVYPADMVGESHDDGEIWSSALWHLREAVGGETADKIVAESIYYLDGSAQFSDGLRALLLADDALFGGAHADAISSALGDRGILLHSLMNLGDTKAGMLSEGDLTMPDGSYYEQYSFSAAAGVVVNIALTSKDFDAYLVLLDPFFNIVATSDDLADGSTNARIGLTIPYPGTYHIYANSFSGGETGQYSLTLSSGTLSEGTPNTVAIAFGREVSGYLGSGDLTLFDNTYYDEYFFSGHVGQHITVSMTSPNMNAYLVLYDADDNIIAQDDDSGSGTDALLTYTLPEDGDYSIAANQALRSSGDYTLLLTSSDPSLQLATIVSGTLDDKDLRMTGDDSYFDPYQFQGSAGQTLSFKMYSSDFDAFLMVCDPYGNFMEEIDDISPADTNAVLEELELPIPGTYFVLANSYSAGETGGYNLAVSPLTVTDTDSDGYTDRIEIAEFTNPLDATSIPDDFDGDFIPDSMDPDSDNDGMSNLAELVAGTDPYDATSFFRALAITTQPEGLTLRWNSSPGRHYAVHRSSDLLQWSIAEPDVPSQGDVTEWSEADEGTNQALFYRIEALAPTP